MKKYLILLLILLCIKSFAQEDENIVVRNGTDFVFNDIASKKYFCTNVYAKDSKIFNTKNAYGVCNSCSFHDDITAIAKSFRDSIKKFTPAKAALIAEKNITVYFVLKPNIKGIVVDASVGWAYSEKVSLFTELELKQLRRVLLNTRFNVSFVEKFGSTQLCQTLTISILPSLWNE